MFLIFSNDADYDRFVERLAVSRTLIRAYPTAPKVVEICRVTPAQHDELGVILTHFPTVKIDR